MASISISGGNSGGGGGGPSPTGPAPLYPAVPAVSTQPVPFDYLGEGTVDMAMFPVSQPVLVVGNEGDAAPRMMYGADSGLGIVWGNGTIDPWAPGAPGAAIAFGGTPPKLTVGGWNGCTVDIRDPRVINSDLTMTGPGKSIRMVAPGGTSHIVAVNDTGALTVDGAALTSGGGAVSGPPPYLSSFKWGVDF